MMGRIVRVTGTIALTLAVACAAETGREPRNASPTPSSSFQTLESRVTIDTHCGLTRTVHFAGRHWLPVSAHLRETVAPVRGFHRFSDKGTMTLVSPKRAVYTSSMGRKVPYRPTELDRHGCL
jgi:hypothetical protein